MSDKKEDWKVVEKTTGGIDPVSTIGSFVSGLFTLGDPISRYQDTYKVEDKWGNQHTVKASNAKELGEKISKGKFDDK